MKFNASEIFFYNVHATSLKLEVRSHLRLLLAIATRESVRGINFKHKIKTF